MTGGELIIVLAAVVVGAVIKSVTGMGLPIIVVPIATLFVDLADAVVVIAVPNLAANAALLWRERHHLDQTRDLPTLLATGIVGGVLGALAFVNLPEEPLLVLLVAAIALYLGRSLLQPDARLAPATTARWAPAVGTVAGLFQGAIGISGPIVGAWIHSYRLDRGAHVASITALFGVGGLAQCAVLVGSGQLAGRTTASALAMIPILASIPVGTWIRGRLSSAAFDRAILGLLAVSGVGLVVRIVG